VSRITFAMRPSAWAKRRPAYHMDTETARVASLGLRVEDAGDSTALAFHGLFQLSWRYEKSGATAAVLVLFALTIILNRAQRRAGLRSNNLVAAIYEDFQELAPLSRTLIARGLQPLRAVEAIGVERVGNANLYALLGSRRTASGANCRSSTCAAPTSICTGSSTTSITSSARGPGSLHALKLYMLLLSLRENVSHVARCSYETSRNTPSCGGRRSATPS
jgi:hypothetical protein